MEQNDEIEIYIIHSITSNFKGKYIQYILTHLDKGLSQKQHTVQQKPGYNFDLLLELYQVGIMSGNQTRPKCFDTSQWISSSP